MARRPKLTDKQRAFIDAYLRCLNATQAAEDAQYKGDRRTLNAIGNENLAKPSIRAEIDRRMKDAGITDDEILFRLKEQAVADFSDAMDTDRFGYPVLDLQKLIDAGKGHLIKEYKISHTREGANVSVKFHDAQAALLNLAKLRGMLKDDRPQWQIEIVQLVIKGEATIEQVEEEFGADLVAELFKSTGATAS